MVSEHRVSFPARADSRAGSATARCRDGSVLLDAREVVAVLFGDDQFANVFLVGAGFQLGRCRLRRRDRGGVAVNGVAVEKNHQAFRRGRQLRGRPGRVRADGVRGEGPSASTGESASRPSTRSCAAAWKSSPPTRTAGTRAGTSAFVERVRKAEGAAGSGSTDLTEAVARHLYKFMAYKDEYEVAAAAARSRLTAEIERGSGPGAAYATGCTRRCCAPWA